MTEENFDDMDAFTTKPASPDVERKINASVGGLTEQHTPEPWKKRKGFDEETVEIYAANPRIKKPFKPTELATVMADDKQGKANARRIVACVNACAGIPLEWLESGTVGCLQNVHEERDRLTKQRDNLLMAIENLHKVKGRYHTEQATKNLFAVYEQVKGCA